jgi:hypothetical protein
LNPMQNSGPLRAPSNGSGFTLVDMPSAPTAPAAQPALSTVGVSAAWRKLVLQANMAAPHLQVAAIEGESGSGKHTLARYIFSRSPLANSAFQRRDAREWLATDADPSALTGYIYLDRVDLLAPPGQGLLLGVLKTLQDRPLPAGKSLPALPAATCASWSRHPGPPSAAQLAGQRTRACQRS